VAAAAASRLVHSAALAEAIRRRRASGGPAERTFATLVGLELRPRMLREATDLWTGVTLARGADGRDALWAHPDLLPTSDDLEDPDAFLNANSDLDISDLENDKPATGEAETGEDGPGEA
jgi:putative hydrolase